MIYIYIYTGMIYTNLTTIHEKPTNYSKQYGRSNPFVTNVTETV